MGKDCVYVCDMGKRTIYSYSFDGKFLHSLSFPYSLVFNDVVELPDGRFLCHRPSQSENCKGLWILDQKGRRVKNLLEYAKRDSLQELLLEYAVCSRGWNYKNL